MSKNEQRRTTLSSLFIRALGQKERDSTEVLETIEGEEEEGATDKGRQMIRRSQGRGQQKHKFVFGRISIA